MFAVEDKKYFKILRIEIIYFVGVIVFLFFLNRLNHSLGQYTNPLSLLLHDNYRPIKFFIVAIIFFVIGIAIIFKNIYEIKENEELLFEDVLYNVVIIVITVVLLILIFILINNPILRAIIFVVGGLFFTIKSGD